MKVLIHALAALALLALQGCASTRLAEWREECARKFKEDRSCIPFDAGTPIYALKEKGYEALTPDEYKARLPGWLPGSSRALLFVHGRGKEPTKSVLGFDGLVEGKALQRLTERQLRPMMFNWDSAAVGLDREDPLSDIDRAAASFAKVLQAHVELQEQQQGQQQPTLPRPVLLVHSMGALVIQRVVERKLWPRQKHLFERIVFSEPDANRKDHEVWMGELAEREQVWVTWNSGDLTLNLAFDARRLGERPLGLGVRADQPLAPGVRYVDLSRTGHPWYGWLNHVVFVACSFGQAPAVDDFIGRLLRGEAIDPTRDRSVKKVDARDVIHLHD